MTIYDCPVDDTVFFPVSGDMLKRMQHDEEQHQRRLTAIRRNEESA